jgi:hypothetical protein
MNTASGRGLAAAGCALLVLASSTLAAQTIALPKADVDYDHAVDFAAFHSDQWKDTQDKLPNPIRHTTTVSAIERELEKKGLRKAAAGAAPDVLVRFYASVDKHLQASSRQADGVWSRDLRTAIDVSKVGEGTLIVELFDGKTGARIWRGSTTRAYQKASHDEANIRSAVELILRSYPPTAAR